MRADSFADPPPGAATPDILLATVMRPAGDSGVQTHVRTFEDQLRAVGQPVEVVDPFVTRSPARTLLFAARLLIHPLSPTAGVWWYRHWHARYLERVLRARLAERDENAVICAQCPVSADVALRARTDQPVVMVAHLNVSQADEWADKGDIPRDGLLFRAIRRFEEEVLPRLDGVVYVSEFSRSVMEERVPALARVPRAVVPNGVAPATGGPATPTHVADLVTVGGLEPRKNQAYLLDVLAAAAYLGRRYTLSVVGSGPDRASLEALSRRLGVDGQVRFWGRQDEPRALVRQHRLYCHTARMESFGIVLIEAMAEGVPVLAAPVGGVPEVVRPGLDGDFWPLDDPEAAARILIGLLDDEHRRRRMGTTARTRVAEEFTPERTASRLLEFLRAVASDGPHRARR